MHDVQTGAHYSLGKALVRFKFAYPLQHRRDAPAQMRKFVASFNSMARGAQGDGRVVRTIGSLLNDKAGEFVSKEFKDFLAGNLIDQKLAPAEVKALLALVR